MANAHPERMDRLDGTQVFEQHLDVAIVGEDRDSAQCGRGDGIDRAGYIPAA